MCGIVGFTGRPEPEILRIMCRALAHRGPDDEGYLDAQDVSLGMRRLSIVDLQSGQQPICNETEDVWVVFNGEIYNHMSLRKELMEAGHLFRTDHADTEVIVHLYEQYGDDWAARTNGMFGIALWDGRKRRLLLYRDRIGKKPLYYAQVGGRLLFASEIKALLKHPSVSRELDYTALRQYFALKNVSAPHTVYRDIRQLLPGHLLVWEEGKPLAVRPYWSISFSGQNSDLTEEESAARLFELLDDAVAIRMDCDVPYGAYLSGGIDSSGVVSLMTRHQSAPVKTFCLGYEDERKGQFSGKAEDIEFARMMAERLGTEHHELIISSSTFAENMPDVLRAFDEPFSGTVSTFFLSILIKQHVKVAISGDGADELFASYLAHRLALPVENRLRLEAAGKNRWNDLDDTDKAAVAPFDTPDQFAFLSALADERISKWRSGLDVFQREELVELLSPELLEACGEALNLSAYGDIDRFLTATDALNRSLETDQRELLPNQVLPFVDRLSMAHSIEVRCPYLDYRIIEFANSLPGGMKIRNGVCKYIHKKSMEGLLPADLLQREKEGFVQPIYSWMHDSLQKWTLDWLGALPSRMFRADSLDEIRKRFLAADKKLNPKVWNLVCFSIWYNEALNG